MSEIDSASGVAVCIITYRRPELLGNLLDHLAETIQGDEWVIVVDNDPAESAREAVSKPRSGRIEYVHEPAPGIPRARNRAVRVATPAEFIAFIDDDVVPATSWLAALRATQAASGADIVTGPVRFVFPTGEPTWAQGAHCFRPRTNESVDPSTWPATNNVLIKRSVITDGNVWFDETYGMAGGSDTQLFRRLAATGATFAWADAAVVDELVPADRATVKWALRRSFRTGNTATLVAREAGVTDPVATLRSAARWIWWAGKSGGSAIVRRDRVHAVRSLSSLARAAGLVSGLTGTRYQEYRRARGS